MARLPWENQAVIVEFVLLGFSTIWELNFALFTTFLAAYIFTVTGTMLIVFLVVFDHHLHIPMYFFLVNLSFLEIGYTSNIVPKMLVGLLAGQKTISVANCLTQFYFFGSLAATECVLLAAMSYDRYLAICRPLHYAVLMDGQACIILAASSWVSCFLLTTLTIVLLPRLTFCGPNEVNHFFCDCSPHPALLHRHFTDRDHCLCHLFCCDTGPFSPNCSFLHLHTHSILRIPSNAGRRKAYSTCCSHFTAVTMFYGTLMATYLAPSAHPSQFLRKVFSLLYTILTPMFNSTIYSLRNRDIHEALKGFLRRKAVLLQ